MNNVSPKHIQPRQKDESLAPSRLPGLNYALLKDNALRKKLQELGIPTWGDKQLLQRRHIEWLHLYNSNCDADESRRKSKRELLKELDTWERIQGGHAKNTKSRVMEKDYDGKGHMVTHKSQFDDLIANARKKRAAPRGENKTDEGVMVEVDKGNQAAELKASKIDLEHRAQSQSEELPDRSKPYEGNESALANIRAKVRETNDTGRIVSPPSREATSPTLGLNRETSSESTGFHDPFASPSRKIPMFKVPEEPVVDVDSSAAVQ